MYLILKLNDNKLKLRLTYQELKDTFLSHLSRLDLIQEFKVFNNSIVFKDCQGSYLILDFKASSKNLENFLFIFKACLKNKFLSLSDSRVLRLYNFYYDSSRTQELKTQEYKLFLRELFTLNYNFMSCNTGSYKTIVFLINFLLQGGLI